MHTNIHIGGFIKEKGNNMKIKNLKIKNFRGYCGEIAINFDEFTALVGKNDIGKSSIMEALDVFFNRPLAKLGKAVKIADASN